MSEDEVVRLTSLLSAAVKFSNTTQREVERLLNLSSGSLNRLFSGGMVEVGHQQAHAGRRVALKSKTSSNGIPF